MSHTPGPWRIGAKRDQEIDIDSGPEPRLGYAAWDALCTVYGSQDDRKTGKKVMEANAKLIAAAPEMRDEIERLRAECEWLRAAMQEAADMIKRCDYTPARSLLLVRIDAAMRPSGEPK